MSIYAGSKHAVEGFTKSAAIEAARFGVGVMPWRGTDRNGHARTAGSRAGSHGDTYCGCTFEAGRYG